MAKKKNEEIINIDKILVENKDETPEVVIENVEVKNVEEKVKVKLKKYHRCFVGDTWFDFQPEKIYIVPKNVKEILVNNDLLLPL